MRYIKYIFLFFVFFIISITPVQAYKYTFEPMITLDPIITDEQIKFVLGFYGDDIASITQSVSYNNRYFSLSDIYPLDNFVVEKIGEETSGKYNTIKIKANSETPYSKVNYAVIVFDVNSNFKVGNSSEMFFHTYEGEDTQHFAYKNKGSIIKILHDTNNQMMYTEVKITNTTKTEYLILNNLIYFIIGIGFILLFVFIILFIIKKTHNKTRETKVSVNKNTKKTAHEVRPLKINVFEENDVSLKEEVINEKVITQESNTHNQEVIYDAFSQRPETSVNPSQNKKEIENSDDNLPKNADDSQENIEMPLPKPKPKANNEEDLILFKPKFQSEDDKNN